ncbi:uncharacterized protein ACA1_111730 [Acanthamoeba castellanii str. Neff]|uniref:Uncharacterized protein n=1 Tax=Acanthamoeba castellanii (strain ATCC 30010 / Neff) TaxID=1257118 RepID=L8H3Y1_ACACF|nr:uncharacterized protein ACA1_111730 [Acanthamoeba castellanii str. Neff]ELR19910.1 hypothetical protein ACA1_111730 [Acanthamoeba castellanii str. Neff]
MGPIEGRGCGVVAYYSTGFNRRKREESKKRQEEERQRTQQQQDRGGAKGNQDEWLRSDERTESLRAGERQVLRLGVPFAIAIFIIAQGSTLLFGDKPSTTTTKDTTDYDKKLLLEGDDGRHGDDLLLKEEEEGDKE